ncbi:NYN domain-containing protein [Chloroflexota bacterium]
MDKPLVNAAFIDGNNLCKSGSDIGWKLDTQKFRIHLTETYQVRKAYYCIGYIPTNTELYARLQSEGYELIFKKVQYINGLPKGNIDAELVLKCMTQYRVYDKAVIVTSDGDFACLVKYLIQKGKLRGVIASKRVLCSDLLREASGTYLSYLDDLRKKLELFINRKGTS